MLRQIGPQEYEVTSIVLDDEGSYRLELLMQEPVEGAQHRLDEAVERARGRLSERPLRELLASA